MSYPLEQFLCNQTIILSSSTTGCNCNCIEEDIYLRRIEPCLSMQKEQYDPFSDYAVVH
jgi:hypothetical protein